MNKLFSPERVSQTCITIVFALAAVVFGIIALRNSIELSNIKEEAAMENSHVNTAGLLGLSTEEYSQDYCFGYYKGYRYGHSLGAKERYNNEYDAGYSTGFEEGFDEAVDQYCLEGDEQSGGWYQGYDEGYNQACRDAVGKNYEDTTYTLFEILAINPDKWAQFKKDARGWGLRF